MNTTEVYKNVVLLLIALMLFIFLNNWVDRAYDQSTREARIFISVPSSCETTLDGKVYFKYDCLNDKSFDVVVRSK